MDKGFNLILYLSDLFYQISGAFNKFFTWCSSYTLNELVDLFQNEYDPSNFLVNALIDLLQLFDGVPFGDYTLFEIFFVFGILYFVVFNLIKWLKK